MSPADDAGDPADRLLALEEYEKPAEMIKEFARGWNSHNVAIRISVIHNFVILNSSAAIPIDRRRKIARLARDLSKELNGLGGVGEYFRIVLSALASDAPEKTIKTRREGQHSVGNGVCAMSVRLYLEASAKPTFSPKGPAFQFVEAIRRLTLGEEGAFTPDTVRAEFYQQRNLIASCDDDRPLRSPKKQHRDDV